MSRFSPLGAALLGGDSAARLSVRGTVGRVPAERLGDAVRNLACPADWPAGVERGD
jgi:hypothetical protein